MHCPSCNFENREEMKFCVKCATPLSPRCPGCGFENPPEAVFCGQCATPLTQRSSAQLPGSRVQGPQSKGESRSDTGPWMPDSSPVSYTPPHLAERILAEQAAMEARGAPDGERKTITALFADLKGSTALIEGLDPEEARAIIDPALQLMMDAVHRLRLERHSLRRWHLRLVRCPHCP